MAINVFKIIFCLVTTYALLSPRCHESFPLCSFRLASSALCASAQPPSASRSAACALAAARTPRLLTLPDRAEEKAATDTAKISPAACSWAMRGQPQSRASAPTTRTVNIATCALATTTANDLCDKVRRAVVSIWPGREVTYPFIYYGSLLRSEAYHKGPTGGSAPTSRGRSVFSALGPTFN
jgi:hypothetical protein